MQWTEKDYRKMDTAIKKGYEFFQRALKNPSTTGGRYGLKSTIITRKTEAAAFTLCWTAGPAGIRHLLRG